MNSFVLGQGPIPKIEQERDSKDWFDAILLSAIYLERYGYFVIKEHFKTLGIEPIERDLQNLHLHEIALFLLAIQKIDDKDYNSIRQVNSMRNKLMHRREVYKFPITFGKKADKEYEPLVSEAIRILAEKLDAVKGYAARSQ